jgi:hypothetical protein
MSPVGTLTGEVGSLLDEAECVPQFRTITIMVGFLQQKPIVAHPMVMVFNASPALTVRKAPSLICFITPSYAVM